MCYSITNTTATPRCATANELCTKSKGAIKWLQRTNGVMQSSCSARGFTRTHDFGWIRLRHHSKLLEKLRCWAWSLATLFPSFLFVAEDLAREEEFAVPQRKDQQAPGFSSPCSRGQEQPSIPPNSLLDNSETRRALHGWGFSTDHHRRENNYNHPCQHTWLQIRLVTCSSTLPTVPEDNARALPCNNTDQYFWHSSATGS